jgi:hypothetical protein
MSQTSRDLADGGDRVQDYNTDNDTRHAPIKFLDAKKSDLMTIMPRALAEQADSGGKHRVDLLYELALLWRKYKDDGEFSISQKLLDELYTSTYRRKLRDILKAVATPIRTHSNYAGSVRCKGYRFNISRPKKAPTYNGIPEDEPDDHNKSDGSEVPAKLIRVVIPAAWLWDRYERWTGICDRNDWTSRLDLDGRTEWGRPLFAALDEIRIPATVETARLTERGVVKMARRKRGRCYDPITNLRKDLRRDSLIDGEPIAEVDIHACYTAVLISKLPAGKAKDKANAAMQTGWYAQFDESYDEWFDAKVASGRGYINEAGERMLRLDDDPTHDKPASIKVEYQRQCLFWRDPRDESNPLRVTLRRLHPEFCHLIETLRQRMTPSELSDVLTRAEGSLVVDSAMAELERAGITAKPNHDGVLVPKSRVNEAREILLQVCEWHLGFRPKVTDKASDRITATA